ncbi:hypothetical protein ACWNYH_00595 [Candidatus Vidania fulgoroideorum]
MIIKSKIINYNSSTVILSSFTGRWFRLNSCEFKRNHLPVKLGKKYFLRWFPSSNNGISIYINRNSIIRRIRYLIKEKSNVIGKVKRKLRGGFEVMFRGIKCFLPNSLSCSPLFQGENIIFKIISFVGSDFMPLISVKEAYHEKKIKLLEKLSMHKECVIKVKIKTITKFGIFATYKGVDGLLKVNKLLIKNCLLKKGYIVNAIVHKFDNEKQRVTYKLVSESLDITNNNHIEVACNETNNNSFRKEFLPSKGIISSFPKKDSNLDEKKEIINKKNYSNFPSSLVRLPFKEFNMYYKNNVRGLLYKKHMGFYIYKLPFMCLGLLPKAKKKEICNNFRIKCFIPSKGVILLSN